MSIVVFQKHLNLCIAIEFNFLPKKSHTTPAPLGFFVSLSYFTWIFYLSLFTNMPLKSKTSASKSTFDIFKPIFLDEFNKIKVAEITSCSVLGLQLSKVDIPDSTVNTTTMEFWNIAVGSDVDDVIPVAQYKKQLTNKEGKLQKWPEKSSCLDDTNVAQLKKGLLI